MTFQSDNIGPCAKQRVTAMVQIEGQHAVIVGENVCLTPQTNCPRIAGEAYAKCTTECAQLGHAEEVALRIVRSMDVPIRSIVSISVYGHTGPCDNCRRLLGDLGLLDRTTFIPDVKVPALSKQEKSVISAAYNLERPSSHSRASR